MDTAPAKSDRDEIKRTLSLLVEPGSVVELRCPKTEKRVVSGYFNDLDKLTKAASYWSGRAEAVYLTLNPVLPDLLARAYNLAEPFAEHTTRDKEVLRRRWFLVDFDPLRPAGISSTDREHQAALLRARDCRDWLRQSGWSEPIYADSGNGAHLLYRVDLPNDALSETVLKGCLNALADQFDDEQVSVDTSTFNASRISKLYGTLAAKGHHVDEVGRPHRLARIVEAPDALEPVNFGGAL